MAETSIETRNCPQTNETGLPCQKNLYHARNGEFWDHAGGHIFAEPATMTALKEMHFDARALLSGQKADMHAPEDCTGKGFCSWRR